MRDSSHYGGRPADPDSPGELAGRLLRRARGGVGIIDAGWAQRRFAHTTDWVAERFAVLGLLNARYGTVVNQAAGTSTALPVVHGSFTPKRFGMSANQSSPHAAATESSPRLTTGERSSRTTVQEGSPRKADNESSPRMPTGDAPPRTTGYKGSPHAAATESSPRMPTGEGFSPTTVHEGSPRTADNESSPHLLTGEAPSPTTGIEVSPRPVDARAPTSGGLRLAPEIPSPSPNISETLINSVVQRKSATPSPDVALPRSESMHTAAQEPPPAATQNSQRPSVREFAPHVRIVRTSPQELRSSTTAEPGARQPSASNKAANSATKKQSVAVRETVTRPHATHESTLRADGRAEASPTLTADPIVVGRSSEPNLLPQGLEQQSGQPWRIASPLPLRETGPLIPRVARAASDPLLLRRESVEQGGREFESPASSAVDPQDGHNRMNSVLPIVEEQTATGHQPQHDSRTLDSEVTSSPARAGDVPAHQPVSAPEVIPRPLHFSGEKMIWRKGFSVATLAADDPRHAGQPVVPQSNTVQNVGSWPTLYRTEAMSTAYESRDVSAGGVGATPATVAQTNAAGIDLEQITEHVTRVILRRVSVERERRGTGRWL